MSVPSECAFSSDLIGICEEIVGALFAASITEKFVHDVMNDVLPSCGIIRIKRRGSLVATDARTRTIVRRTTTL